jgi:hypothetical protein
MVKHTDTLGTIANSVYGNKKKWKNIWANNKPLIKNPNVIYAGFTLYYTNGGMANFARPKSSRPTKDIIAKELVIAKDEEQMDEAIQTLSSTDRKKEEKIQAALEKTSRSAAGEKETDLINNVSVPADQAELAPDIDEEIQTL